jgi:hypothetical protein
LKANISRKGLLREGFTVRRRRGQDKPDKVERRKIRREKEGKVDREWARLLRPAEEIHMIV